MRGVTSTIKLNVAQKN